MLEIRKTGCIGCQAGSPNTGMVEYEKDDSKSKSVKDGTFVGRLECDCEFVRGVRLCKKRGILCVENERMMLRWTTEET